MNFPFLVLFEKSEIQKLIVSFSNVFQNIILNSIWLVYVNQAKILMKSKLCESIYVCFTFHNVPQYTLIHLKMLLNTFIPQNIFCWFLLTLFTHHYGDNSWLPSPPPYAHNLREIHRVQNTNGTKRSHKKLTV